MLAQIGIGEISCKLTLAGDGNRSRLLGGNDDHRVALLAHAYGGSVAGSELSVEIFFLSQRKDAARGNHPAVADNSCSVMERCAVIKDVAYQLTRHYRIDRSSALYNIAEERIMLKDYKRARLALAHALTRSAHGIDRILYLLIALRLLIAHAENIELRYAASADGFKHMAQFGLKENDEDYNYLAENFFEYKLTCLHIEQVNGKISNSEKQKTLSKLNGLRLTDELDNTVKNERNKADIQEIREGKVGKYHLQLIPERCDLFSKHRHTSLQFL